MSIPLPKAPSHRLPSTRLDALWDADAPKYRVFFKRVHVLKMSSVLGYGQLTLITVFCVLSLLAYGHSNYISADNDLSMRMHDRRYEKNVGGLVVAIGIQMALVLMLLRGIERERRSLLLPYIAAATLAAFLGVFQISVDYTHRMRGHVVMAVQLCGLLFHVWTINVIWRCYCYLGDKKVAQHIGEQLQATQMAFAYEYAQPPAYNDLLQTSSSAASANGHQHEKQPINIA